MTLLEALEFDYKTTQDLDVEKLLKVLHQHAAQLAALDAHAHTTASVVTPYMPPQAH